MKKMSLFTLLVSGFLFLVGCGSSNPNTAAKVSGRISYNGTPIKAGGLIFVSPEGTNYPASIDKDGTYFCSDLPVGELIVVVETESVKAKAAPQGREAEKRMSMIQKAPPGKGSGAAEQAVEYLKIPSKYNNQKTSPLTIKLSGGRQVKDIDLTD